MVKEPLVAIEQGQGDCKAVALIACALESELELIRHSAMRISGNAPAYIHYLALRATSQEPTLIHTAGWPNTSDGQHIIERTIRGYTDHWSLEGEKRAKPKLAVPILEALAVNGDDAITVKTGGFRTTISREDPNDHIKGMSLEDLIDHLAV